MHATKMSMVVVTHTYVLALKKIVLLRSDGEGMYSYCANGVTLERGFVAAEQKARNSEKTPFINIEVTTTTSRAKSKKP